MKKVLLCLITLAAAFELCFAAPFQTLGLLRTPDAYLLPNRALEFVVVGYYRSISAPDYTDEKYDGFVPYCMVGAGILDRVQLGLFVGDYVQFINAKVKVLQETDRWPQLTVGIDNIFSPVNKWNSEHVTDPSWDFYSHPDRVDYEFFSPYVVASKQAVLGGLSWMFNLGLGLNRYYGQVPRSQFLKGLFSSVEIFPFNENLGLQGEYDGKDFNVGLKYVYREKFAVRLGAQAVEDWAKGSEGNGYEDNVRLALGLSYKFNFPVIIDQDKPRLGLKSPQGRETWPIGSSQIISWTSENLDEDIQLILLGDGEYQLAAGIPVTAGSFNWVIPGTVLPGSNYRMKISTLASSKNQIRDLSRVFAIIDTTTPPQSIVLESPNGGENWLLGSTHPISWTSENLEGKLNILLESGSYTEDIKRDVSVSSGLYSWSIPETIPEGSYSIRLVARNAQGQLISDASNETFSLTEPLRSVMLTSPNGGEAWTVGGVYSVTWETQNIVGRAQLILLGANEQIIASDIPPGSARYDWTIDPTLAAGSGYRMLIMVETSDGRTFRDESDALFSILEIPKVIERSLTLLAPNGGESWTTESTYGVTWQVQNVDTPVTLLLVGNTEVVIAEGLAADTGYYNWLIPSETEPGDDYRLRIRTFTAENKTLEDDSDATFAIVRYIPPRLITLKTPNGGERWALGTTQNISWTSENLSGYADIILIGAASQTIVSGVNVLDGSYDWSISWAVQPGEAYRMQISTLSSLGESAVSDVSNDMFAIYDPTPPPPPAKLVIISPNGGEMWPLGSSQIITWASESVSGFAEIILIGTKNQTIVSDAELLDGSYTWSIPWAVQPGEAYRMQINTLSSQSDSALSDTSDAMFAIYDPTPPASLELVSPKGGEEDWVLGTEQTIAWNAQGLDETVEIRLSGEKENLIIASGVPANSLSYKWTIPASIKPGDQYRVTISGRSTKGEPISDSSEGVFAINEDVSFVRKQGMSIALPTEVLSTLEEIERERKAGSEAIKTLEALKKRLEELGKSDGKL